MFPVEIKKLRSSVKIYLLDLSKYEKELEEKRIEKSQFDFRIELLDLVK